MKKKYTLNKKGNRLEKLKRKFYLKIKRKIQFM